MPPSSSIDSARLSLLRLVVPDWLVRMRIDANLALASMRRGVLIVSTEAVALALTLSFLWFLPIVSLPSVQVPANNVRYFLLFCEKELGNISIPW